MLMEIDLSCETPGRSWLRNEVVSRLGAAQHTNQENKGWAHFTNLGSKWAVFIALDPTSNFSTNL